MVESPEIITAGDRNVSSFEGPAGTELELVDMVVREKQSLQQKCSRNGTSSFLSFSVA